MNLARQVPDKVQEVLDENKLPRDLPLDRVGISHRDPQTGSWTKLFWKPRENTQHTDPSTLLKALRENHEPKKPEPSQGHSTFGVSLNDFQLGKKENGGTEATLQRIRNATHEAIERFKTLQATHDFAEVMLVGGGDLIESCWIFPNQPWEIDLNLTQQIDVCVSTLLWILDQWSEVCDNIVVVATKGNHGEVRLGGKQNTPGDNFDLLVWKLVEQACSRDEYLRWVNFVLCAPDEESAWYDTKAGWRFGTTHGDVFGKFVPGNTKMLKAWNWYKNMSAMRHPVGNCDVLLTHHFHHDEMADWGACLWRQTRAMDGGSKYFSHTSGQYSKPGMLTWVMTPESRWCEEYTFEGQ